MLKQYFPPTQSALKAPTVCGLALTALSLLLSGCQGGGQVGGQSHDGAEPGKKGAEAVQVGAAIKGRAPGSQGLTPNNYVLEKADESGHTSATSDTKIGTAGGVAFTPRFIPVTDQTAQRIELKTDLVKERDLVLPLHLTGHVEPDIGGETDVSVRITGRVTRIDVRPGDKVVKGQLLAMIDSREVAELEGEMVEAKSKLDIAQAHANRERQVYEEQIARPKALLDEKARVAHAKVKLDLALSEFHRVDDLYREKIAAGKDYVAAKANVAEAKVEMEQAQTGMQREQHLYDDRVLMKKDYQLALAEVTREKQHLNTIIRRLEFIGADRKLTSEVLATGDINGLARIVAPVDGVLNRYEFSVGELVHPEQSMFKLTDLSYVQVYADLPEIDLQRVKLGDVAKIKVPSYPNAVFEGTISLIAQRVHVETRSVPIRARLANADGKLKPNMYAELDLRGTAKHCLSCPIAAVQEYEGNKIVFVKKSGGYEARLVKVGAYAVQYVEIVSGVQGGEEVATQGSLMLKTELSNHR
ncbi:MAG: efflux RND transporter periplasmic adaptor subunit [Cyanobacteria bacterium REEB67]|nr:efflux RND transporter periplasmic adaptor subunit [Cyanobacteria bacterium REEB67]